MLSYKRRPKLGFSLPERAVLTGLGQFEEEFMRELRILKKRMSAISAQMASTIPKGQAPCINP